MKQDSDPTELVSCGKCSNVNTVPFGLDKFKCYGCNSLVLVSREPSAACAAASSTALYYNDLEASKNSTSSGANSSRPTAAASLGSDSLTSEAPKKESVGFFGKLQQKMDKTMQKVDKTLQNLTTSKPTAEVATPPSVPALVSKSPPPPGVSSEEDQLQWALNASLAESRNSASPAATSPPGVMMGRPPGAPATTVIPTGIPSTTSAGDQLQAAATQVAQRLQGSEERAAVAEKELAKALEREAAAIAQREELKRQLDDNESVIKGLTEQIDAANAELESKVKHCHALEDALAQAQQMADQAADSLATDDGNSELERQGTVAQLLARIAELESTLLRATHFAPEETAPEENDETTLSPPLLSSSVPGEMSPTCEVSGAETEVIAKHEEVLPQTVETDLLQLSPETVAVETAIKDSVVMPSGQESPLPSAENPRPVTPVTIAEAPVTTEAVASKEDLADLVFDPPPRSQEKEVDKTSEAPTLENAKHSDEAF